MKIAVALSAGTTTLGRFGHESELFILDVQDDKITHREAVQQAGGCCGGLASRVKGVDVVLCDGIGHGAMNHLSAQGTQVARPKRTPAEFSEVVRLWLEGAKDSFFVKSDDCNHAGCDHGHGHGHDHGHQHGHGHAHKHA